MDFLAFFKREFVLRKLLGQVYGRRVKTIHTIWSSGIVQSLIMSRVRYKTLFDFSRKPESSWEYCCPEVLLWTRNRHVIYCSRRSQMT